MIALFAGFILGGRWLYADGVNYLITILSTGDFFIT
jgi:hypothetical protein